MLRGGARLTGAALLLAAGCAAPSGSATTSGARPAPAAARSVLPQDPVMERFVDSVLAGLTLEEKLGQLNQPGTAGVTATGPEVRSAGENEIRAGRVGSLLSVNGAAVTRRLQRIAAEESRARIPLLFGNDVIHGHRTISPIPLAEAASWDPEEVERSARWSAYEATAFGINWTYAPMVDVARDPRWGRIMEGSGEDPYLGSAMAAARVRGFQGEDLADPTTMLATAKHFVAYGAAEGGRDYNIAEVPERTLREVYLPPFRAAVEAGVGSVMAAFNEVAGVPMHAHRHLIQEVLRRQWGWEDGLLVSDYTGVTEMLAHGVAADSAAAAALALRAGVDIDMVSQSYLHTLAAQVTAGRVPMALVDESVRRVLRAKYRLGLFEDPYRYSDTTRERLRTMSAPHVAAVREMARKSIVLLKNAPRGSGAAAAPLLPLRRDVGTLAVIGPLADDSVSSLGGWAAIGRAEDVVTALAGIRQAVSARTRVLHARGAAHDGADTSGFAEAVRVARRADVVVMVLGEHRDMTGEARNRTSLDLPGVQEELLRRVHATGKPVVLVLMNGRPLSIPWAAEHVPAIVEAWFLGVQTGPALADVLFGDVSPGGKLPVSFPRTVGQVPIYYAHRQTGRPPSETEHYTSKYLDVPWTPLYPFGHGLSYTTFEYDPLRLSAAEIAPTGSLEVSVTVTNTGRREGDEVVQLYVRDDVASVTRPVKELRGFERVTLRPGERRTLTFTLGPGALAFHDAEGRHVVEPGTFTVFVGGSSATVRETRFRVTGAATEVPDRGLLP